MKITCIALLIRINLYMSVKAKMENTEYNLIYFSTNEAITLKCNCRVSFWSGPVVTNFGSETSPVTITDIYGNPNVWNVTIYMHGGKVANTLPEKLIKRLNVIGDNFDLHITNLSNSDQGLYICDLKEFCLIKEKRYLLQQKLLPEKIEIENVTHDNTVIGIENYPLNLVCFVESGKPHAVLTWRRNGTFIEQGGPRKLRYSFIPKKTDHQSVYICEVQNQDMEKPLTKQIHLSIKYKPCLSINVSKTLTVVEGEIVKMCSRSRSNPKITSMSWHKEDKELVSTFSNTSLCYLMINVSRYDTGNYIYRSHNEIGNASRDISLIVLYSPTVNIVYRNLTEYSRNNEIRCIAQGEPNTYDFFTWQHQSLFNEHIRYLVGTDDGILRLPEINESNIYQDTGFYICNVSNGIPDDRGNVFQLGRAYYLVSIGPPVFTADNIRIQESDTEASVELKVKVSSSSEIICHNITEVGYLSDRQHTIEVSLKPILIKKSFHDSIVTVNGIEITFVLNGLKSFGCRTFNVTVCNRYGQSSVSVDLQQYVSYSSEEKSVSFQVIIIIALLIIIVMLVVGTGMYFRYLKRRYKQRMLTALNIQTSERNGDEIAHYAEIIEDDNMPSQGNNTFVISTADGIVAVNRNLIHVSDEYSSTSSENDTNAAERLDDGYEKPYTTLMENIEAEDKHIYLITQETQQFQHVSPFVHAACGHLLEFTEQASSLDTSKINPSENDDQENIKHNYVENYETDDDLRQSNVYTKKKTVEYINLLLKQ